MHLSRYRVNEPTVIQEIIDGEAIIADLSRGFYYSLDEIGSQIWGAVVAGRAVDGLVDELTAHYSADSREVTRSVNALIDRLLEDHLIVPLTDEAAEPAEDTAALVLPGDEFVPPVLSKYTDMEQLLLLDPIHDVDETGWPNAPEN